MTELKPCPFCGSKARMFTYIDHTGRKSYGITCEGWHYQKEFYDTEAEAIAEWNRRPDDD